MAVTDWLSAPAESTHLRGQDVLHRFVRSEAGDSQPVTWTNQDSIQSVTVGEPTYGYEVDVLQQGSHDKTRIRRQPQWPVTINVLNGKYLDVLAAFRGVTLGAGNYVIQPMNSSDDIPDIILESIYREVDGTHVFSVLIQDLILDDGGFDMPMDYSDGVIKGHTYHPPFMIDAGFEAVLDVWDATASTNTYTLSSTPATLLTSTSHNWFDFDNVVFIKNKDHSAGDTHGRRYDTGVSVSTVTMTWTTNTPAATDVVSCLYVTAT